MRKWSYSRWATYETCPRKYKFDYILQRERVTHPAALRGTQIHEDTEKYLRNEGPLPDVKGSSFIKAERDKNPEPEVKLAFNENWEKTEWSSNDIAVRMVIDSLSFSPDGKIAYVTDWKTGKYNKQQSEAYSNQLQLYALGVLIAYPGVEVAWTRLVYLDANKTYPPHDQMYFTKYQIKDLISLWENNINNFQNDTEFRPTPSFRCRWCNHSVECKT